MITEQARTFLEANAASPIVSGRVLGKGGEGAIYTLKDGRQFVLGPVDLGHIPDPRWDIPVGKPGQ